MNNSQTPTTDTPTEALSEREAFERDFAKYKTEWSDDDCPLLPEEVDAYKAGHGDGFQAGREYERTRPTPQPDADKLQQIAEAMHYPACWDTVNYPTLLDAVNEMAGCTGCSECKPTPQSDAKDTNPPVCNHSPQQYIQTPLFKQPF